MIFGLNNNMGTSNNTNRTQNSSKVNNKNFKSLLNGADILDGLKNGKNGGERIRGIINALLSGDGKS